MSFSGEFGQRDGFSPSALTAPVWARCRDLPTLFFLLAVCCRR